MAFCNLAGVGGERFAASGNVGMLDIVAALEWVRDNIEGFGGDPGNVTIMGQSGGGAKITTLTAMPRAKGLFHRAVVLSGASLRMGERQEAEKLGAYVLEKAGLTAAQIDKLQELPWPEYYALATKALERLRKEQGGARGLRRGFNPVVDGDVLPQDPYCPEAAPTAAHVPMIICSTFHEISPGFRTPGSDEVTLDEVAEQVKERAGFRAGYGDKAKEVVEAYARAFPDKTPFEIWALVSSTRQRTVALADAKSKQPAPVYSAWLGWQPPLFDGRMGAFHCGDICFWFHNTDLMLSHTGGGARPRRLATILFWMHLVTGVIAAVVVFLMSVTGVALTYQRQLTELANRDYRSEAAALGTRPLEVDALLAAVREQRPGLEPSSLTIRPDPARPVVERSALRNDGRWKDGHGRRVPVSTRGTSS